MTSSEHFVCNGKTLCTSASESQWNQEMSAPALKEEKIEFIDEEEPPCRDFWCSSELSEATEYENKYNMANLFQQVKEDPSEEEKSHSRSSFRSIIAFEDDEIKIINKNEFKNDNTDEELFLNLNVKVEDKEYQDVIKTERLEDQGILDIVVDTSIHYELLVTPGEVECKFCGRIFKNCFNLLTHNMEHMKLVIKNSQSIMKSDQFSCKNLNKLNTNDESTPKNDAQESYECQHCMKSFKCYGSYNGHVKNVHSTKRFICKLCDKEFKCSRYFQKHIKTHAVSLPGVSSDDIKCISCNKVFKNKRFLGNHLKKHHSDEEYNCEACGVMFKNKVDLSAHAKRVHYDYGRVFECWCGRQFRLPSQLAYHRKREHIGNENNSVFILLSKG